jgi:hypothetical protein
MSEQRIITGVKAIVPADSKIIAKRPDGYIEGNIRMV